MNKLQPLTERPAGLNKVNGGLEYIVKTYEPIGRNKYISKTYAVVYGENKVLRYDTWTATDALVDFWNKPPVFKSFMQAVMWLKENASLLM